MHRRLRVFVLIILAGGLFICLQYALMQFALTINDRKFLRRGVTSTVKTFVFLKTHKTGSGTLTSIFSRFADNHNLEMALPMKEMSRFSWPLHFSHEEVDLSRLRREKANVLCHHAVFGSKSEFEKVMYPGAKYITILRHPVDRFESQFFYDNFNSLIKEKSGENLILAFLNARDKTGWKLKSMTFEQREILRLFTNGMLFDLTGEQLDKMQPKEDIDILIKETESDFDFIMLTEYFDEGLVLLRKYFGWTLLDIVYRMNHVRKSRHKELLTEEVRKKILAMNQGDQELYKHFLKKFKKNLKSYGETFGRHLEIFRELNKEINRQCSSSSSDMSIDDLEDVLSKLHLSRKEYRTIGDLNSLPNCFCTQLHRDEVSYVKYFRSKYEPYYFVKRGTMQEEQCS